MITGFYVRIMRAGKAENLDITELTDEELVSFFATANASKWAFGLVKWIRENVKEAP